MLEESKDHRKRSAIDGLIYACLVGFRILSSFLCAVFVQQTLNARNASCLTVRRYQTMISQICPFATIIFYLGPNWFIQKKTEVESSLLFSVQCLFNKLQQAASSKCEDIRQWFHKSFHWQKKSFVCIGFRFYNSYGILAVFYWYFLF